MEAVKTFKEPPQSSFDLLSMPFSYEFDIDIVLKMKKTVIF